MKKREKQLSPSLSIGETRRSRVLQCSMFRPSYRLNRERLKELSTSRIRCSVDYVIRIWQLDYVTAALTRNCSVWSALSLTMPEAPGGDMTGKGSCMRGSPSMLIRAS